MAASAMATKAVINKARTIRRNQERLAKGIFLSRHCRHLLKAKIALEQQHGGEPVHGIALLFGRAAAPPQGALGFSGSQTLIPKNEGKLKMILQALGKLLRIIALAALGTAHVQRPADQ